MNRLKTIRRGLLFTFLSASASFASPGTHDSQHSNSRNVAPPRVVRPEQPVQAAAQARVPEATLVVDVDETLCITDYGTVIWGIGRDESSPLPNAVQVLKRLGQDFRIVYLTARPRAARGRTERWLAREGFPKGEVITSPTVIDFIAQTSYKRRMLEKLRAAHPNMVIGIGDKPMDAEAYRKNGLLPVIVNPWRDKHYRPGEIIMRDWAQVGEFFRRNREVLTDRRMMAEAVRSRGDLPLLLSEQ